MKRYAANYLQEWITLPRRKPLVMRGARQVGKTWLVRDLAHSTQRQLVEINFEETLKFRSLFNTNDPVKILRHIETELDIEINPDTAILFLDEIQSFPEALAKLRWFYESMPALPVIAAGSLLDFTLAEHEFSMPVGRIDYLHVEPLSFEEFLFANGLTKLVSFLHEFQLSDEIPLSIHEKLMSFFREYLIVGGMPSAVFAWVDSHSPKEIARVHTALLLTYRDDFAKYAGKISTMYLDETMMAVPTLLGQKFVYSQVNRDVKIKTLKQALNLLCKARICFKIEATSANGLPLRAEVNDKYCKVGFLDTGLVSSLLGLRLDYIESVDDINLVNQGALSEQVVAQLLRSSEPGYIEPHNFYWRRTDKSANAEIDFILQHQHRVIPIEVKSGKTGSMKSLQLFMQLKKYTVAVRINADFPSVVAVDAKGHDGKSAQYQLLSIPFYFVEQLHRLLKSFDA